VEGSRIPLQQYNEGNERDLALSATKNKTKTKKTKKTITMKISNGAQLQRHRDVI